MVPEASALDRRGVLRLGLASIGAWGWSRAALAETTKAPSVESSSASPAGKLDSTTLIDRVVVRFTAAEIGGPATPEFIFERELAFEARLEALEDTGYVVRPDQPYRDRHLVTAMERHIAETLLSRLGIDPEPSRDALERQSQAARVQLLTAVGGARPLGQAKVAEGISVAELSRILRRRARASLYLHTMIAPMLEPRDSELRAAQPSAPEPYRSQPFPAARAGLRSWYVGKRLAAAAAAFYQGARTRVKITVLQ